MTEKRKRRKATTELGRQLLQRERQRLARESAAVGEAMANEARNALNVRTWTQSTVTAETAAISRGMVRRIGAVLASEGVNVPLYVRPTDGERYGRMSAWTDFAKIDVTYKNYEDKRMLAATLRAMIYHEGGHCRWSDPLIELWKQAREIDRASAVPGEISTFPNDYQRYHKAWNCLEDQRMETAVVSDSPRKASYLTPLIMAEHTRTVDAMAANYPLLVWRKYLPVTIRRQARKMFIVRHADKGGEMLARELEAVVSTYVLATDHLTMWNAVVAYQGLLERMHPLASDMSDVGAGHSKQRYNKNSHKDDDYLNIPVSPDMRDEDVTDGGWTMDATGDDTEEDVDDTIDTTDPEVAEHLLKVLWPLWWTPWNIVLVREVIEQTEAAESEPGEGGGDEQPGEEQSNEPGEPGDEQGDDGSKDGEGGGNGPDGDEDVPTDSNTGGASGTHTNDGSDAPFTQDDLDKLIEQVESERYEQRELTGDMEAFGKERWSQDSMLDVYVGGISTNGASLNRAENLAEDIEQSFTAATMDRAPAWVEQQRRGVINVQRYVTAQPGDTEYFRQWTEDDAPGYDIAVSVLLDYSISMRWATEQIAEAGFAAKLACQNLGIPCTVTLWDSSARVLWDANEQAEALPTVEAMGGTDPSVALADLDNQRCDRPKHIVLIMTDGEWSDEWPTSNTKKRSKRHLAAYKDAGRVLVGFGMAQHEYERNSLAEGLVRKGCDEAFAINDLMVIPQHLERILLQMA